MNGLICAALGNGETRAITVSGFRRMAYVMWGKENTKAETL